MANKALIPSSAFTFLRKLAKNNNRDWFKDNKPSYQAAYGQLNLFKDALVREMEKYDEIESAKLFRIYRDVRFSKDKSPYKNHFSGYMKRATAQRRGGYYFHIEPGGKSIIGGGFFSPSPADLKHIRQQIAANDKPLRKILKSASFKKYFGTLQGEQVKTAPKGFSKDHPAIDLIRHKQFYVVRRFKDKEVTADDFLKETVKTCKAFRPFFDYMTEILTTDLNGESLV